MANHIILTRYALYDSRYTTNEKRATCYTICDTLKEARKEKREDFDDAVIVKLQILVDKNEKNKGEVINTKIISK